MFGMSRIFSAARAFPWVTATLAVIAVAGVLSALRPEAVPWVLGVYAGAMALRAAVAMVAELRSGTFGVDILAVTAIGSTIAVGSSGRPPSSCSCSPAARPWRSTRRAGRART